MDNNIAEIMERLAREMTSWKSIDLKVHYDRVSYDGHKNKMKFKYIETNKGERFYESLLSDDGNSMRESAYCDGARCAKLVVDPQGKTQSIVISRSFNNEDRFGSAARPRPLEYFSVGLTPLYEAIAKAKKVGSGEVIGRPCEIYLFEHIKCANYYFYFKYCLDTATSIPLRVEVYRDAETLRNRQHTAVWQADSLDTFGGYHLPKHSHYAAYQGDPKTGEPVEHLTMEITIDSADFNNTYHKTMFWPKFEPGVHVLDGIKDTAYRVPGGNPAADAAEAGTRLAPDPIRATPPRDWSSYSPAVGMGLGLSRATQAL